MTPIGQLERLRRFANVTICIAAACHHSREGGPKIILCSDWRISGPLGSSDTKHKQDWLPGGHRCLIAGDPREATAIVHMMRAKFLAAGKINETNIKKLVEDSLYERRVEKRNALAQAEFGMSHSEVMQFGKERLPTEHFIRYLDQASMIRVGAEFIVAGFSEHADIILETNGNCDVSMLEDFSCIGEGATLAHASLLHRGISAITDFGVALYYVYEAKKAAERVNSVGKSTLISTIHDDGTYHNIVIDKIGYLDEQYSKYGPQQVPLLIPVPEGLFH
jgi:hypothetical protein